MKREILEDLELSKEVIDKIMAEHGKDINSLKEQLANSKQELAEAQTTISNLEKNGTDNEAVTKELAEYKEKVASMEKAQLETKRAYKLKEVLQGAKAKNADVVLPLLSDLEFDGENFKGLDEKLKSLKEGEATSFLFETEQQPPLRTGASHNEVNTPLSGLELEFQKLNPNIKL